MLLLLLLNDEALCSIAPFLMSRPDATVLASRNEGTIRGALDCS